MFDLVIIGAGPGGYVAALCAGRLGLKTVLIEKDTVGGVCLNRGCIPTKSILYCSNNFKKIQNLKRFGIETSGLILDEKKVTKHKQQVVKSLVTGVENLLIDRNVEVIKGIAEIKDNETVIVDESEIKTRNILLATGSNPLDIPPARFTGDIIISADKALTFEQSPDSVLIVGAGVIGLEMATYFSQIGKKVYIVEILDKVLPAMNDEEISNIMLNSLKKLKIKVFLSSKLMTTEIKDNKVYCKIEDKEDIIVDKVLLATGRKPNIKAFECLPEIIDNKGFVKINNRCKTLIDNIYACGDITGEPYLAHKASYQAEIAVANISGENCISNLQALPSCVFTSPHIAYVGLSPCEVNNENIIIGNYPYSAMGKAKASGIRDGFVRIVGNSKDHKVIGGQIVGENADILLQEITLAIRCGLKVEDIAETIHIHPSLSEIVLEAAKDAIGKPLHKKIN